MLSNVRTHMESAKTHVFMHRAKYTAAATALTTGAVAVKLGSERAKQWNAFLEEKGLTAEFYALTEA